MKFLQIIFLFSACFIFFACEDLSFTDKDIFSSRTRKEKAQDKTTIPKAEKKEEDKKNLNIMKNEDQILEEETTVLSEDLELSENTVIQNRKVILDMLSIQTLQYDLTIIAEEFVSNHSFIRNFPEEQTANEKEDGRKGGQVLIKAKTAKGNLGLILNGEHGGPTPKRSISRMERADLSGRDGENGYDAVYDTRCRDFYIPLGLGLIPIKIFLDRNCWEECRVKPTKGENGEDGRPGYPGHTGKKGGDSGSFYLQAFNLSDFYLTEVKKMPGFGSRGGKGSAGGYGGERGKNGRDKKNLCSSRLPQTYKGKKGERGKRGKDGENGKEGAICLESLKKETSKTQENSQIQKSKEKEKTSLATNNNQPKPERIDIRCKENKSGIICPKILIQSESENTLEEIKEENVICY